MRFEVSRANPPYSIKQSDREAFASDATIGPASLGIKARAAAVECSGKQRSRRSAESSAERLGQAPGVTAAADTALAAARKALSLLSLGLIAAGVKRELEARPQDGSGLEGDWAQYRSVRMRMPLLFR
jgi:hypothetical protein